MFGRLFGKKKPPVEEATWAVATAQDGDMPIIIRFREKAPVADKSGYRHMIAVTWSYEPVGEGMPPPAEKQRMDEFEDLLTTNLEASGDAYLTVVVTGNGVREMQWYARSPDAMMAGVNQALAGRPPFPVEFSIQDDPEWEAYGQFAGSS